MTPAGTRAIITMGEVKGIIDIQKAMELLGSVHAPMPKMSEAMMGTMAKVWSCEASWMLSTAAPMAA